ncbi:MAG: RNA polymerase sporulation sigma factor SigH [Butyrivibrio sp.]|jgi:RNA polymerase sporulation-specific sigma factor|nr:RNA polymerase sporulation sigma factor SigH [Butyrivibrio sp.]MCR4834285.1 RNA polymerase sporulation sigma factor SigH [Butyrivibrio sp.]
MNSQYESENDEVLIRRLRDGENDITDYIMDKYKNLVRKKAATMFILGADRDDLIQEGMIGLFKAIRDYDSGRDASFYTFADLCISRQMYSAIQASNRKKHIPLNSYISLYSRMDGETSSQDAELVNNLEAEALSERNPEEQIIDQENVDHLEKLIETELSSFEREVLDLYMTGMSYTEIAKVLNKDEKSTDNALQRTKIKLRKGLEK